MPAIDPRTFWNDKILGWEESRYLAPSKAATFVERMAGRISSSLRFRLDAAVRLLAPHLPGRQVVELGCGSGLLAERLISLGAAGYRGIDIADRAIAEARYRHAGSPSDNLMTFEVAPVLDVRPQGDALVFSLGLFDWLSPEEICHIFTISRQGHYFHAVAERRLSAQQLIHRAYVHFSYGRRTGYRPQYHSVADIDALLGRSGLPPATVYRNARMRFGIFVTDLALERP
ncbi:methyltransferase domain-containing protein [Telmatospirillum sp.]|uniref:class I SAM-dependent methyltransferase n=1 Tax=Telmatospirillum sp. TaxID=2079197 RepID=UPI00283CA01D|nr:methyltransferase domain-containing protein [Telmatospirillum sp.]MDR3437111.1 methyltransferase domain-containing protein [Telmatospirillum sp.]